MCGARWKPTPLVQCQCNEVVGISLCVFVDDNAGAVCLA